MEISDWIIAASVGVALFIGVGNWIRDACIRAKERRETSRAFAILIAHDMLAVNSQGRDARKFLEESRHGPNRGDDGQPINVFANPFPSKHYPLFIIDEPPSLDHSAAWARYIPADVVKTICSTVRALRGWNDKASSLKERPLNETLPEEISDDLVFTLERIQSQSYKAMLQLDKIAEERLSWWRTVFRWVRRTTKRNPTTSPAPEGGDAP